MDLATMVTRVRRDLKDEDSQNYQWTDDELERHIARALSEFSYAWPDSQKTVKATTADSWDLDISSLTDVVKIDTVEYPIGERPAKYNRFSLWGDILTIVEGSKPDGSNCNIYWGKMHTLDVSSSTIPTMFEELVAIGAAGFALVAWADYSVNQVNLGGADTPDSYISSGNLKLKYFRQVLKRQGKRGGVLATQLYTPATPPVSQTRDPGP
jgi:hypothetical protein